jgi:hypothetical protein
MFSPQRLANIQYWALLGVALACFWLLLRIVVVHGSPFPFSDEWGLIKHVGDGMSSGDLVWLIAPHVDHRIPLLKLYNMLLLPLSGFDFRIVQATNGVLLFVACLVILRIIFLCKRRVDWGDFAIPLILLNVGFGAAFWAFSFQFLSSTLLLLGFCFAALSTIRGSSPNALLAAVACVFAMPLCGMNGVVPALLISVVLLVALCRIEPKPDARNVRIVRLLLVGALMVSVTVVLCWRPSGAATVEPTEIASRIPGIVGNFFRMIKPNPMVGSEAHGNVQSAFGALLAALAIGVLGQRLGAAYRRTGAVAIADVAMASALAATLLLILAVAIGRSAYWSLGLERHYGFFPVALTIISWAVVSLYLPRYAVSMIGIVLLAWSLYSYSANLQWRTAWSKQRDSQTIAIYGEMARHASVGSLVALHIRDFYFVDTQRSRQRVAEAIELLRARGVKPYAMLKAD